MDDEELVVAFPDMVENHKMVVEIQTADSGSTEASGCEGKEGCSILSGGNMDVITMSSVVQNGLIARDQNLHDLCTSSG